jgi:hypothetical protein
MDSDPSGNSSGNESASSVGSPRRNRWGSLQQRIEQLIGPLHERRSGKDRRQVKRISAGRRYSD